MRNKNCNFKLIFAKQTLAKMSESMVDSLENDIRQRVKVKDKER